MGSSRAAIITTGLAQEREQEHAQPAEPDRGADQEGLEDDTDERQDQGEQERSARGPGLEPGQQPVADPHRRDRDQHGHESESCAYHGRRQLSRVSSPAMLAVEVGVELSSLAAGDDAPAFVGVMDRLHGIGGHVRITRAG